MSEPYILGVDIGTTFTAAAVGRGQTVTPCTLGNRTASVPTVVAVLPDGQVLVGEQAERRAASDPTAVAREFKRRLGDTTPLVLSGQPYSPEQLMAHVLRWVVREVTRIEDRAPDEVVLTHPAAFGPYKVQLMGEVARLADVANARLLTEPQAAATAYARKATIEPGKVVAVYDFGGGTFDAALVRRTSTGGFALLGAADGIDRLGGVDVDQLMFESVVDRAGVVDPAAANPADVIALRQRARDAKEALATDDEATVVLGIPAESDRVRILRADLSAMIRPRVMETIEVLQRVIRNSGVQTADVDRVLLVGGSSRLPLVADTIRTTLGLPVTADIDPKTAICVGAASPIAPVDASGPTTEPTPKPAGVATGAAAGAVAGVATGVAAGGMAAPAAPSTEPLPTAAGGTPPTSVMPPVPVGPPPSTAAGSKRNLLIAGAVLAIGAVIAAIIALSGGTDKTATSPGNSSRNTTVATNPPAVQSPSQPPPLTAVVPPLATNPVVNPATNPATTPSASVAPNPSSTPIVAPTVTGTTPVAATQPPVTTPVTTPATTPLTSPPTTPPAAVDRALAAKLFVGSLEWDLNHLAVDPQAGTIAVTGKVTSRVRGRVEVLDDPYSIRFEGSDFGLDVDVPGDLAGERSTSAVTLSSNSLPPNFDIAKAQLIMGRAGDHQAVVDLGTGKVLEDLAPVPLTIAGTATTASGVTFKAVSAAIIPLECAGGSGNFTLSSSPKGEWSMMIVGDLKTGATPVGGTTITGITHGFTRLKLPDGFALEASTTIDDVFGPNERHRDGVICFSGLQAPGDGAYQLQIQAGPDGPVGTIDITVPAGAIVADTPAAASVAPDQVTDPSKVNTVFWAGGRWDIDSIQADAANKTLRVTGTVTNLSRNRFDGFREPIAVRTGGSDVALDARTVGSVDDTNASSRFVLRTSSLPDGFDPKSAQLIFGQSGNHQAVVRLDGTVVEDLAPVPVTIKGTATTGSGIAYTVTGAEIVPWACSGGDARISFANGRADEWSLIVEGEFVSGAVPVGGLTIDHITGGFTRLKLPDGSSLEAANGLDSIFGSNERLHHSLICFTGLQAPGDGAYQLQIQAGNTPPVGTVDVTIPAGAIAPDTSAAT